MSKASYKIKRGESSSQYRQCVRPCPRYITSGDTHSLCVVCLGVKHAESALEGAGCPHCERLPLRTLRSQRALFEEGAFASVPRGAGPASAEAELQLHSWGSQLDLAEGMETGGSLSPSAEIGTEKQRSKLDERFLRSKSLPLRRSLPFFPDLHTEVSRLWRNLFSSRLFI